MALSAGTQELVDAQACTVQGALNIFETKIHNKERGTEFLRRFHDKYEIKQSEAASISLAQTVNTRDHSVVTDIMLKVRDYFAKHGYNCDNMSKIQGTGRRVNQISTDHEATEEGNEGGSDKHREGNTDDRPSHQQGSVHCPTCSMYHAQQTGYRRDACKYRDMSNANNVFHKITPDSHHISMHTI
jgi:hypothetical protein